MPARRAASGCGTGTAGRGPPSSDTSSPRRSSASSLPAMMRASSVSPPTCTPPAGENVVPAVPAGAGAESHDGEVGGAAAQVCDERDLRPGERRLVGESRRDRLVLEARRRGSRQRRAPPQHAAARQLLLLRPLDEHRRPADDQRHVVGRPSAAITPRTCRKTTASRSSSRPGPIVDHVSSNESSAEERLDRLDERAVHLLGEVLVDGALPDHEGTQRGREVEEASGARSVRRDRIDRQRARAPIARGACERRVARPEVEAETAQLYAAAAAATRRSATNARYSRSAVASSRARRSAEGWTVMSVRSARGDGPTTPRSRLTRAAGPHTARAAVAPSRTRTAWLDDLDLGLEPRTAGGPRPRAVGV